MTDKTDIELMQQALNDLEALVAYIKGGEPDLFMQVPSIEALRERLARPEQEPVAVIKRNEAGQITMQTPDGNPFDMSKYIGASLYTGPLKQEPVAWLSTDSIGERYLWFSKPLDNDKAQPLYTAPQKREWQGAFFDAVYEAWHSAGMDVLGGDWNTFASTLEAKLKEKNT